MNKNAKSFLDKYDDIISLGYVCNVVSYINKIKKKHHSYVFDRIATPLWGVCELIENDFTDFLSRDNLKTIKLFDKSDKKVTVDSKYYVRVPLKNVDKLTTSEYELFYNNINSRKNRFVSKLESQTGRILFIRSEEPSCYCDLGNRLSLAEYDEKYAHDEYHHLKLLSDLLKQKYPELQFRILFLSGKGEFIDDEHNIVGIPAPDCDFRDHKIAKKMKQFVDTHEQYLQNNL